MDETRWLEPEEQDTWRAFLLADRLLFAAIERDTQRASGLPLTHYEVLSVLSDAPRRSLRMSELAQALQVSPSRVSHAVSRLEGAGLVRRDLCPADRRSWFAVLTDEGFDILAAAAPAHVESVREHVFDQLTPDQLAQLHELSRALLRHLSSVQESNGSDAGLREPADSACEFDEVSRPG